MSPLTDELARHGCRCSSSHLPINLTGYKKADSDNVKIESKITLKADGKDSSRKLQVVVYDKANNKTVKTVKDFSLNANWIVLLFHYNWPLLVGIGAALAVLAGLLIFLKNKKKKNAAE